MLLFENKDAKKTACAKEKEAFWIFGGWWGNGNIFCERSHYSKYCSFSTHKLFPLLPYCFPSCGFFPTPLSPHRTRAGIPRSIGSHLQITIQTYLRAFPNPPQERPMLSCVAGPVGTPSHSCPWSNPMATAHTEIKPFICFPRTRVGADSSEPALWRISRFTDYRFRNFSSQMRGFKLDPTLPGFQCFRMVWIPLALLKLRQSHNGPISIRYLPQQRSVRGKRCNMKQSHVPMTVENCDVS